MPALMSSVMIYLTGRLVSDPVFSETAKGKTMAKLLLEAELVREVNRGEFRADTHVLPVLLFSRVAEQAQDLRNGSSVTIAARLNGTSFTLPSGEVRHGVQLIADALFFAPSGKEERRDAAL
jgi:single-stranded DNA-binding protein